MNEIFNLIIQFFITGLLAIGGGMATIPFLYNMGGKFGWFTDADVLQMLAVSESTPGPIGVNMATYVGFTVLATYGVGYGILGGIIATLSLVLPSIIVIIIVARILDKFKNSPVIASVFVAIRPASLALISASGISVMISTLLTLPENFALWETNISSLAQMINYKGLILGTVLFIAMKLFDKLHPIVFIAIAAVVGIIFKMQ